MECVGGYKWGGGVRKRRNGITTGGKIGWIFLCGVVGNTMVGAAPRNGFIPDLIPSNKLFFLLRAGPLEYKEDPSCNYTGRRARGQNEF